MAEILPRIDILESPRRDADFHEIKRLDEAVHGEVDEARQTRDRSAQRVGSRDKSEVLPTTFGIDRDRAVWSRGREQGLDGVSDVRVITCQDNDAVGTDGRQRSRDARCRTGERWIFADDLGRAGERPEILVPHNDDGCGFGDSFQSPLQQGLAVENQRVLGRAAQPPGRTPGQHDRIEDIHAVHIRLALMSGTGAQPRWRTEPVSFIRRGGRLSERQQAVWDALAATHVIDVPRFGPSTSVDPSFELDAAEAFGRSAPLVVEIGSGRGDALVAAARSQPDVNFLGLEVYVPGVAQTLVSAYRDPCVENVRMAIVNAPEALATMLPPGSVREVRMWFPDPWHKKRHHKRRLITVEFTELVGRVLEPGGIWRIATDWDDYAEWIGGVLATSPFVEGGPVPRFVGRLETRFERKGTSAGRAIHDFEARVRHTRP